MANIVVFQGVEVTVPLDVAFAHREGCLEIDLTGLSGKLQLRPAPGVEQAGLRQLLPAACIPPLQRLLSDSTLVKDSPDPPVSQGWKNLPATWLTASPVGSRHAEQHKDAADTQPAAAERLSDVHEQRSQEYGVDIKELQPDTDKTDARNVKDEMQDSVAPTPALEQSGVISNVEPTVDSAADGGFAHPEPPADADKENNVTDLRTPAPANAKELKSARKEKRSCEGAPKSGSASAKRQKASAAAATPPKELAGRWRPLEYPKGPSEENCPCGRWGSSFTALSATQGCLYGGHNTEGHLGDAWLFDSDSSTWQQTATSDFGGFSDAAKAWHAAAVLKCADGDQLVVYGGEKGAAEKADRPEAQAVDGEDDDDEDSEPISDVCQLCPQSHYWVILPMEGERNSRLPARTGSTITAMPDGRGLVFGGLDIEGKFRNDAFIVDPRSCRWFGLGGIIKNAPPKPRAYHTATLVGNRLIVMGGLGSRLWSCKEVYSLQLDSWKWTEHTSEVEGDHPVPRSGHAAVALPDGRHLALFGGGDADKDLFFANVAILDTLTWRWSTPKLQSIARPSGRAGHSMVLLSMPGGKHALVVHGGRTKDSRLCKDTWLLELTS